MGAPKDEPGIGQIWAEREMEALRAAIAKAEEAGGGREVDEIEAHLVRELRNRKGFLPQAEIRIEALRISDPDWFKDHPGQLEQMLAAEADSDSEDRSGREADRVLARLQAILDRCRGIRSFSVAAHRTVDGYEYEIGINPRSSRLATRVERKAAPTPVVVEPLTESPVPDSVRRIASAVDSIRAEARGLPVAVVEARLLAALGKQEATLSADTVEFIARGLADPWSGLKHPIQSLRDFHRDRKLAD